MNKKKLERINLVDNKTLVVGVDIGKYKHLALARTKSGHELKAFEFKNSLDEFKRLISKVKAYMLQYGLNNLVIAMEPTGHYWENLAYYLDGEGIEIVCVNPLYTNRMKQLEDNSPGKTDPKDAGVIADLTIQGKFFKPHLPKGEYAHLRRLAKMRDQKVCQRGAQKNILIRITDYLFPEYQGLFHDLGCKTSKVLMKRYLDPERIQSLGKARLLNLIERGSKGILGEAKAEEVYFSAKNSIGIREAKDTVKIELRQTLETIELMDKQIKGIEGIQKEYLDKIVESKYLLTIPGIGISSAASLLGEIGDIKFYKSAKEIIKLAGLNLYEISSGLHKGKRHITRCGRSLIRKTLYFVALNAIRTDMLFKDKYNQLRDKGLPSTKAIVAIMIKLIRIIYAVLRDKRAYDFTNVLERLEPVQQMAVI